MMDVYFTIMVIIVVIYYLSQRKFNYWKVRNLKYLSPMPFVGNYSAYIFQKKTLGETVQSICQKWPNEPLIGAFYGTEPVLIVQDPEYIKLVTTTDFYYFNGREVSDYIHKETLSRNIFFANGNWWNLFRKNLSPFFTSINIKRMFPLIANHCKSLDKLLETETQVSKDLDVSSLMMRYTLDCICSSTLGIDPTALSTTPSNHPFVHVGRMIFSTSTYRGIQTVFRAVWPNIFYGLGFKMFPNDITDFFLSVIKKQLQEREDERQNRHDLIDFVAKLQKEEYITGDSIHNLLKNSAPEKIKMKIDDVLLVTQVVSIFAAGFETSATTMSFVLFELAKNPEIQQRVLDEIDQYNATKQGGLNYTCITELPYLYQCIQETLRLYPSLQVVTREVFKSYRFPNGVQVDRGVRVHIPVLHMHRNPKHFKDPHVFNPDRFSPEQKHTVSDYVFMPFGKGPRLCIGSRFGKMQMMAGLVSIFTKYRLELLTGASTEVQFEPRSMPTQPKKALHLKFISRNSTFN
ncbi:unnamed protein product [Plutella xylostella]|uniref:unspecific monooxygenase n=1 Tax=Plutella xylostella TaxID=51655 RepID=A0A8S4DNZ0_PLUXY|nr:unnamed protein product [Plutella xylostella]